LCAHLEIGGSDTCSDLCGSGVSGVSCNYKVSPP